jgi:hypothetical protein
VHTHCPECALHATGINECEEDRAYPFFDDASAHSRVWKLTTNAVDFALESAVEDTQANPLELPDAAASAAVDAFLIVLAESMAAFSEQQIRTIISYSSVKAFTELAKTEDSPVFSQLLKFDDWHRICIDLNIPYEGFPRFTFNNFANSIRTRIRERILETASA